MQWWCSAQGAAWDWSWQYYPGVWAFIAGLAIAYALTLRREVADQDGSGRPGGRPASFAEGLLVLWLALDWPLGALGAGYLASAHMAQFLLIALIAPPLLLRGVPESVYHTLRGKLGAGGVVAHPLVALVIFNLVVAITHLAPVVDALMASQLGSFIIDMAWLGAGLLFWWPVVGPVRGRSRLHEMVKVGYLGSEVIALTPLFAFLTFSRFPQYATYELAPRVHGFTARADQQLAGLMMKVGGMLIFLVAVGLLFLQWSRTIDEPPVESDSSRRPAPEESRRVG